MRPSIYTTCMAWNIPNSPCRQVREHYSSFGAAYSLTVTAFAVYVRVNLGPLACGHAAALYLHVRAWLIASRKKTVWICDPHGWSYINLSACYSFSSGICYRCNYLYASQHSFTFRNIKVKVIAVCRIEYANSSHFLKPDLSLKKHIYDFVTLSLFLSSVKSFN